jgi:N-glycosylase/DNA lyase
MVKKLLKQIEELKNSEVKTLVDKRMKEFSSFKKKTDKEIFKEMCFCLMTANFNAQRAIMIQQEIDEGFITFSHEKLNSELKRLGHRFPNMRAKFIFEARKHLPNLKEKLFCERDEKKIRNYLAKEVKGLGLKEASHFLRNVGFRNLAIIDFHIADILEEHELIKKPKTMSKKAYEEIELVLEKLCEKTNLCQGELDFYLWHLETGKVLK